MILVTFMLVFVANFAFKLLRTVVGAILIYKINKSLQRIFIDKSSDDGIRDTNDEKDSSVNNNIDNEGEIETDETRNVKEKTTVDSDEKPQTQNPNDKPSGEDFNPETGLSSGIFYEPDSLQ